jgi:hypothetical protein
MHQNRITSRFSYFDSLRINGHLLEVEAHTVFPEEHSQGYYRIFYSVFGCSGGCTKTGEPAAPSTRTVWCNASFGGCRGDRTVVRDGQTLGLVTQIDGALLLRSAQIDGSHHA